jgi:hypothetical protein
MTSPATTTKKNSVVRVEQFEDADEEDENEKEITLVKVDPTSHLLNEAAEDPIEAAEDLIIPKEGHAKKASTKSDDIQEEDKQKEPFPHIQEDNQGKHVSPSEKAETPSDLVVNGAAEDPITAKEDCAMKVTTKTDDKQDDKEKKPVAPVGTEPSSDLFVDGAAEDPIGAKGSSAMKASTKTDDKRKDKQKKPVAPRKTEPQKTEAKRTIESPVTAKESGNTTPVPTADAKPLSASSPLDALASIACVADERRQANKPDVQVARMTKEDTHVSADEISCTDGTFLLLLLLQS